jgi:hypothetical protein
MGLLNVGGVWQFALDVRDADGNLANPDTVTLQIMLPTGQLISPAVPNPPAATGMLRYDYVTQYPGQHKVAAATTNPSAAWSDTFNVAEQFPPAILGLADAKQCLGIDLDNHEDDDELRGMLAGVTWGVENYKHEAISMRTITDHRFFGPPWGGWYPLSAYKIRLYTVPVIALISVIPDNPNLQPYNIADLSVDSNSGLVSVNTGPPVRGWLTFTYAVGYSLIPYNYLEGTKVFLQHVWETRRGPGGVGGVIGPEELADYRHYTSLPRKATEWLGAPRPTVI